MVKLALEMYEDSLCACGHSSLLSYGHEGVGEYEQQSATCHACKELERDKAERKPGEKRFVRDLHDEPRDADSEVPEPDED